MFEPVDAQWTERPCSPGRQPIHLWIYNHPFYGISDQIDYFVDSFRDAGYSATVGRQPRTHALNFVIENFSPTTRSELVDFCRTFRKRVGVIMTEHIDFIDDTIHIHGEPLWTANDYMHPATQISRLANLMACVPYTRCFTTLGDLPELQNVSQMIPGIPVVRIPFPQLKLAIADAACDARLIRQDLLFTGFMTGYRREVMTRINAARLSVFTPIGFVSRHRRNALNRASRIVLNIPQRECWHWLSLMRIYAALRCGRATISLGTSDSSKIAACCVQIPTSDNDSISTIVDHVERWRDLFEQSLGAYKRMAAAYEAAHPFPHELLDLWAITDGIADGPG